MKIARAAWLSGKALAILIGIGLTLGLLWLAINLFDESPSATAKTLLQAPPNRFDDNANIYVAMAGIDAPVGQDPVEAGRVRINAYNAEPDRGLLDQEPVFGFPESTMVGRIKFVGDANSWQVVTSSIWERAKSHGDEIATLLAGNQVLYERYLQLHLLKGYYETSRPSDRMPIVYPPPKLRALFLAETAHRIQTGTLEQQRQALADLTEDLQMWRVVLSGNGMLISKMLAAAALQSDELLLGDMVADGTFKMSLLHDELRSALLPFPVENWQIGAVFESEFRYDVAWLRSLKPTYFVAMNASDAHRSWWQRAWPSVSWEFYKAQATENGFAELMWQLKVLATADPATFSQARDRYRNWLDKQENMITPRALYNPVGRALVIGGAPGYESYVTRVYDVAALQRLAYLTFQIRVQNVDDAGVPSFMEQHPEWATHVVDGRPFRWNPSTGELSVVAVAAEPEGRRFGLTLHGRH